MNMKILYVLDSGQYGGVEQHVLNLVEGMNQKGYEVYVWCLSGPLVADFERYGAKVFVHKLPFEICPSYIVKLVLFLKKNKIDIVHAHKLKSSANALIAAKLAGTKLKISHIHTPISEWNIVKHKKLINLFFYPKIINAFSDYEIALTKSRKRVKMQEGVKEKKLKIIKHANAVKFDDFFVSDENKPIFRTEILKRHNLSSNLTVWGCIGRVSEEKGHFILAQGFARFLKMLDKKEREKHFLLIIGGGPLQNKLQETLHNLNIEENSLITGKFLDTDKKKYYATLDYFVHPSLAEGFGIVLIEAMAARVPLIASDLEVFDEVGSTHINYFKKGNSQDLAEMMLKLYYDNNLAQQLANQAYSHAKNNYSFNKFIDEYDRFYKQALHKK